MLTMKYKDLYKKTNDFDIENLEEQFDSFNRSLVEDVMEIIAIDKSINDSVLHLEDAKDKIGSIILNIKVLSSSILKNMNKLIKWVKSFVQDSEVWVKDNKNKLNDNSADFKGSYKKYNLNVLSNSALSIQSVTETIKNLSKKISKPDGLSKKDFNPENILGMSKKEFKRKSYIGKVTEIPSGNEIVSEISEIKSTYEIIIKSQRTLLDALKSARIDKKSDDADIVHNANKLVGFVNQTTSSLNLVMSYLNRYLRSLMSLSRSIVSKGSE